MLKNLDRDNDKLFSPLSLIGIPAPQDSNVSDQLSALIRIENREEKRSVYTRCIERCSLDTE